MAIDICPCPKKSTRVELVTIEGQSWWVCRHQGCELRVSGARHYWRPEEHQTMDENAKKKGAKDEEEETEESDDA